MKKKILSFIMLFAVTFCFANGCKNDNNDQEVLVVDGKEVVATIDGVNYTADQIYEDMISTNTSADYLYKELENLLVKTVTPVTESMKNRINNEIEKWKKDIRENASINGTSYKTELQNALTQEGVSSEEELYEKKIFELQKEIITNQYWTNNEMTYYKQYLTNNYVYHISQILVNVSDYGNKDSFAAEVNESTAKKLYTVTKLLTEGTPFYQVAEVYSDDNNTKDKGGDLGLVTLNDTSLSDEVKYALASYGVFFEDANVDYPEYLDEVYGNGVEAISQTYINKLGEMYSDTTSHITATDSVLSGSVRVRARNILFNNLFNSRTFRFLQADTSAEHTRSMSEIKLPVSNSSIYELSTENQNIVLNESGYPILVVRSDSGIHFISINKSAFAGEEELLKYYSKTVNDEDEYVTYVEKGIISSERDVRLEKLETLAKEYATRTVSGNTSFSGNEEFINYDMFMSYLNDENAKFKIVNESIKNIVVNYIKYQKEYVDMKITNVFKLGYDKLSNFEKEYANTINVTREIPLLVCLESKACTYTFADGFTATATGGDE